MINNNYGTENSNIPHSAEIDIIGLRREEYQGKAQAVASLQEYYPKEYCILSAE